MSTKLQSAFSTPDEELLKLRMQFPMADIMAAKVVVKMLVLSGIRKGPSDLLVLPGHLLEQWFNDEAVRYLQEQKALKHGKPAAEL